MKSEKEILESSEMFARGTLSGTGGAARASAVNRTHRVVRAKAGAIAARRRRTRGLWIPIAIFSVLLVIICTAAWNDLEQYDVNPNGILDASNQFLILFLWFFPASMALLAVVLFRRNRKHTDGEAAQ